jgi:outer membrane receptor for ferrienterochelin and colicin
MLIAQLRRGRGPVFDVSIAMRGALLALALLAVTFGSIDAAAQQTGAQIVGEVVDSAGNAVAGAEVTVTHIPSGTRSVVQTNTAGTFAAAGVRVGGPFKVEAKKDGFQTDAVDDVVTALGEAFSVTLKLAAVGEKVEEVVVTGARTRELKLAVATNFDAQRIDDLPTVSRDIKEIVRTDPKIFIDATNLDAISIAGTNNRYNKLSVDGIRQNDDFGLNQNGYPTQRSPISLDAIQGITVRTAPFSVEESNFQGGSINIETRSGTNEFKGSVFYFHNDDSLAGDKSKTRNFTFDFEEKTFGARFGGPILKDKVFFFLSYEKLERTDPAQFGAADSQSSIRVPGISQADYNQIVSISRNTYGFDPLDQISAFPEDDEKILAKLDWQISDAHRATFTLQKNEGNGLTESSSSLGQRILSTPSNNYNRAAELDTYSLQFYSNWTDWLTTELKLGRKEVVTLQEPLAGGDFAEFRVTTSGGGRVNVGPDEFRHANQLNNDFDTLKLKADMRFGAHTVTTGFEVENLEVFNLFVPRSEGVYFFNSIADFAARRAQQFQYRNAPSNNENDGAANFKARSTAFYLQDSWKLTDTLTLSGGLRYDRTSSDDDPVLNNSFTNRYGFNNLETLDGRDLLQPRLAFNWRVLPKTSIRGGIGLFGGGTPTVWVSNSYSNDGVTILDQTYTRPAMGALTAIQTAALENVDGRNIPAAVLAVQPTLVGDGAVNAISPDFELASVWKYNLGVDTRVDIPFFGDNWRVTGDVVYTDVKDAITYVDARLTPTGTAPDGRRIYGTRPGSPAQAGQDFILTNTERGSQLSISFDAEKSWSTRSGTYDFGFGYGYQDADDVNPGTSTTASSNWDNIATSDPNDLALAVSNYEIKHRATMQLTWRKAFFGENETRATLYFERRSGRPYSYTFGRGTTIFGDPRQAARERQLLFIPLNPTDVDYAGGLTAAAFDEFVVGTGLDRYRGQIAPRNAFSSPWVSTADLRLSQQLPAFGEGHKFTLTLDVRNFANLLNKKWGQLGQVGFPFVQPVIDASIVNGRYVYRPLQGETGPRPLAFNVSALPSVWRMQLGLRYEF